MASGSNPHLRALTAGHLCSKLTTNPQVTQYALSALHAMAQPGKVFSDTKHCSPLLATGTSTQSCIEAFSTAGRFHVASTIGGGWWGYEIWSVRKLHHLKARMVPMLRSGLAYHGKGTREAHLRSIMRTACLTTSSNHWGSPLWIIKDCQYTTYWP